DHDLLRIRRPVRAHCDGPLHPLIADHHDLGLSRRIRGSAQLGRYRRAAGPGLTFLAHEAERVASSTAAARFHSWLADRAIYVHRSRALQLALDDALDRPGHVCALDLRA